MTPEELARWIAGHPRDVVPFVGAGLVIPAGAPSANVLATKLAARLGLENQSESSGLARLVRRASDERELGTIREALAEIITGLRLRPTPALTAVCGAQSRRILTTNYDDGLERAAATRGLEALALLPGDPRMLDEPQEGQLHVVHLHGLPNSPETLVLPGATTNELDDDEVFATFARASMAPRSVVFLGFGLALAEVHLHHVLRWLSSKVPASPRHYLMLPADELASRPDDMELIASYGNVDVVAYAKDSSHSAVEQVALALAPRAQAARGRERLTWVEPPLLRLRPSEDSEQIGARMRAVEGGWGSAEDLSRPEDLIDVGRALLVAGPGSGKSTLLERLAMAVANRPTALGRLRDFQIAPESVRRPRAIQRLLRAADGEPIELEVLEGSGAVFLLDGLDEVIDDVARDAAISAIHAAAETWPEHAWVVSSRPGRSSQALADRGFVTFRIPRSRSWARTYLATRSVPTSRVERAMLDGYGLGDLMCIPLFAERLADRLLDTDNATTIEPLALLVDEQYAASKREARRHGYRAEALAEWLRSLAIGLELRGRTWADVEELAAIARPDDAAPVRAALVEGTLLADVPGRAEFPAKPLQEGLCADTLLHAVDPVSVLTDVAVDDVLGTPTLRDDIELTLDLVFEHADRATRARLRDLDAMRWALTVATRGTAEDGLEAFDEIWRWHADYRMRLGWGFGAALRSSREAVVEIVRQWPEIAEARAEMLERELESPDATTRSRALAVLSTFTDERAREWVLPRLDDEDARVIAQAAAAAGDLRLRPARDRLLELLGHRDDDVRASAVQALIEIVEVDELPDVVRRVRGEGLRRAAPRVLERVDLDTGLRVAAAGHGIGTTEAWLLDRLIETAHPDAWSTPRIRLVMRCLEGVGGGGEPDLDLVAGVLARHPDIALGEVRVRQLDGRPYGPRRQLLAISRLDARLLDGDDRRLLREAVARALEEQADIEARQNAHVRWRKHLASVLDARGSDISPAELDPPHSRRDVEERHIPLLCELVDRWWPSGPIDEVEEEGWLPATVSAALRVGAALEAPLTPERWRDLLEAHLRAGRWPVELGQDGVTAWLRSTYDETVAPVALERIGSAQSPEELSRLVAITGAGAPGAATTEAALVRLREVPHEEPGWGGVIGLLAERGGAATARSLLSEQLSEPQRWTVIAQLARYGDPDAQIEVVRALTSELGGGGNPPAPHWFDRAAPIDAAAAAELADTALVHGHKELSSFAVGLLVARDDLDGLHALVTVAQAHPERAWLRLTADRLARSVAGARVRQRLPDRLADLVAYVDALVRGLEPSR